MSPSSIGRFSVEGLPVPTHFYTVVTSCQELNQTVEECGGDLQVFSFLIPHRADNSEVCNVSGKSPPPEFQTEWGVFCGWFAHTWLLTVTIWCLCLQSPEDESEWVEDLLKHHTARVRDVEILTGLDLYRSTNLTYIDTLRLKTYLQTFESDDWTHRNGHDYAGRYSFWKSMFHCMLSGPHLFQPNKPFLGELFC